MIQKWNTESGCRNTINMIRCVYLSVPSCGQIFAASMTNGGDNNE